MHFLTKKQILIFLFVFVNIPSLTTAQVHCPEQKQKNANNLKREIYICGIAGAGEGIHIEAHPSKECGTTNKHPDSLEQKNVKAKILLSINLDSVDMIPGVRIPLVTSGYMATDCIKDSIEIQSCRDYFYNSYKLGRHKIGTLCDLSLTQEIGQRDPIALALGEPQYMKTNWSWSPIVNSKRKIADADFCLYGLDSNSDNCSEQSTRE